MRRIALIAAVLTAAVALVIIATSATGGGGDPHQVRAIFDDAASAVQGEEVRIAGAPVGTISSLDVCVPRRTPCSPGTAYKAAVTFRIDNSAFWPFHANAFCAIRPQSLIGEKYVDCNPGTVSAPPLTRIASGPGAGSDYLPVTHTSSPVDTDIVQNIYREPVRQQFSIIINELGTGLAARGSDLNAVIHRADPALGYTDQVLQILARQNRQLAQLAHDSDVVLTPLARDRREISDFVVQANTTSVASASRATAIARSIRLLPAFLRQLRPLMADLGNLADQATPVFGSLNQSAGALGQQFRELAPFGGHDGFADVARRSLIALGAAAVKQQPALVAIKQPLVERLLRLGNAGVPSFTSLGRLTKSLDQTGAIEQLMALLFNGTGATNGFDSVGHFIRTEALVGSCTAYAKTVVVGCSANFTHTSAAADTGGHPTSASIGKLLGVVRDARASGIKPPTTGALARLLRYLIGNG